VPHRSLCVGRRGPNTRHRAPDPPLMGLSAPRGVVCRSSSALVGPSSAAGRVLLTRRASRPTVTRVLADPGSRPEAEPLQSSSRPSGGPSVRGQRPRVRLPEVCCPSTTSLDRAPYTTDHPGPSRFRPRGSLAPSAASWLDRASGVLGVASRPRVSTAPSGLRLPSELSLRVGRAPLVGVAGSLVVLPDRYLWCGVRCRVTRGFTNQADVRASRPRRFLHELGAPFQHVLRRASRSPWTSHAGLTTSRPFRRLRSVLPHCESVHVALDGHPVARAVGALLGVLAPPEPCSRRDLEPSSYDPPPRSRRSSRGARHASRRASRRSGPPRALLSQLAPRARSRATLDAGWASHEDDRNVPYDPSADTKLVYNLGRAVRRYNLVLRLREGGSSDSHDLGRRELGS